MFSRRVSTAAFRAIASGQRAASSARGVTRAAASAAIHTTAHRGQASKKDESQPAHAGSFSRTDETIILEYPKQNELPSSEPVTASRSGMHQSPTLATFSLVGKVGVVTGGARGLGLVMGQGMVVSGADLAIVDLDGKWT